MKPEDILDAIGEVDEAYIQAAKRKRLKTIYGKAVMGTAVACLVLALLLPVFQNGFSMASDARNENLRDEIGDISLAPESAGQENKDILSDCIFDEQTTSSTSFYQAEIREFGTQTVKCLGRELSASLQAALEGIAARDSDGKYDAPEAWGYSIQMTDNDGNVTRYVLQDNALYNCTDYEYHILNTAELAALREAMGLR